MGKHVIILGGGNVAFDCARSAKRLGAEETFERITGEDHVTGVDFMNVESFTFDENRRAIIKKEAGSEHHIDADTVIFATGQRAGIAADAGLELGRANSIATKAGSAATSVEGIFAAGDAVYGTKSVIMAIEAGRQAASEIDRYLGGDGDISEKLAPEQHADPKIGKVAGFAKQKRIQTEIKAVKERDHNFDLMDFGICDEKICSEAGRCLQCDLRLQITPPRLWGDFKSTEEGRS